MSKRDDYREYFKSVEAAKEYDESSYSRETYASVLWDIERSIITQFIVSLRKAKDKTRYLDFACGTGRVASVVENLVDESYATDISQAMLDRAATKTKHTVLIQGDVTANANIVPSDFDVITVFRFVLNAQAELRDCALKIVSGKLRSCDSWLIFNMHANKYSYAFAKYLWYRVVGQSADKDEKRYLSRGDCIRIAHDAGLDVIRVQGVGFLSGKLFSLLPLSMAVFIETQLARVPVVDRLGTDLIFFCRRKC
jgi:SAM-dependent methyltransferase